MKNLLSRMKMYDMTLNIVIAIGLLGCLAMVVCEYKRVYNKHHIHIYTYSLRYDAGTGAVNGITETLTYGDGTQSVQVYTESSAGINPLLDPLYAGNAPIATGYDPAAIYASEPGIYQYNRGIEYGDYVKTGACYPDSKIMPISFPEKHILGWIGPDGRPIATVQRDRNTFYVAFYGSQTQST